jgi:hypothetical protein
MNPPPLFLTIGDPKTQPDVTDQDDTSDNFLTSTVTGHMLINTEYPTLYAVLHYTLPAADQTLKTEERHRIGIWIYCRSCVCFDVLFLFCDLVDGVRASCTGVRVPICHR